MIEFAFLALAHDDELQSILAPRDRAHQPSDILDRAQPRQRADDQLAGRSHQPRNGVGRGRHGIAFDINAVADQVQARRWLTPHPARYPLQHDRWHHQPMGARQPEPAIQVAPGLQPVDLVDVEPILMVDQRRQAHGSREQAMRHHRVHGAPVIAEDQVIFRHERRDGAQARQAHRPDHRHIVGKVDRDMGVNRLARAHVVRHAAQDAVPRTRAP